MTITRKEYLERSNQAFSKREQENAPMTEEIHHEYYSQFVTDALVKDVAFFFGTDELARKLAADKNLNNIELSRWDRFCWHPTNGNIRMDSGPFTSKIAYDRAAIEAAGETVTRAVLVCIAKTAARIAVERARSSQRAS